MPTIFEGASCKLLEVDHNPFWWFSHKLFRSHVPDLQRHPPIFSPKSWNFYISRNLQLSVVVPGEGKGAFSPNFCSPQLWVKPSRTGGGGPKPIAIFLYKVVKTDDFLSVLPPPPPVHNISVQNIDLFSVIWLLCLHNKFQQTWQSGQCHSKTKDHIDPFYGLW